MFSDDQSSVRWIVELKQVWTWTYLRCEWISILHRKRVKGIYMYILGELLFIYGDLLFILYMEIYLYEDLLYRFICFIYGYIWRFIILCTWIYTEIIYVYTNDQIYIYLIIHNTAMIMKTNKSSGPARWEVMLVSTHYQLGSSI